MHFVLHIFVFKYCIPQNQATEYASQHIWCLSQGRINWEGCGRKVIRCKNAGEKGGSLISPDGVAPSQIVGVSASVIFPCTIKSRRFLLAPAHSGSPRKRAVTWLRVSTAPSQPPYKALPFVTDTFLSQLCALYMYD